MDNFDVIELKLPLKAEYVSIVRLTASGISNRIGFDIDSIEDIKVAIAEVCNKLITVGSATEDFVKIIFRISKDKLTVIFDSEDESLKCIFSGSDNEFGLSIINALMDEVELCSDSYILSISKVIEGKS
ncbi:ATP-binding protein [Pseudobacteroides cellulosolvens]|uniref:Putative anti-sigma regulatory factor, serine/threonine protein kinase n=1 Tax=Pseudobacteroides cellulosolvens ATCC 35603 = DSM 2933 TaxID=398512 RepID=A0A0L6JP58_9FIRM|nr:ATP-binding protein [Pseudobacteroides cellulosolvens]KNY27147.1 putative anti-sigma regulatory factor, serine/threonine protein kinase [Pseudobacteroides cellulosolvens ATCC 35603 = DSM 2933]